MTREQLRELEQQSGKLRKHYEESHALLRELDHVRSSFLDLKKYNCTGCDLLHIFVPDPNTDMPASHIGPMQSYYGRLAHAVRSAYLDELSIICAELEKKFAELQPKV